MATLRKPKLLLLDEHTAALDPKTAEKVLELAKRIVDENGLTTIMITHNMREALRFGNRLLMLNDGEICWTFMEKKNLKWQFMIYWKLSRSPAAKMSVTGCC